MPVKAKRMLFPKGTEVQVMEFIKLSLEAGPVDPRPFDPTTRAKIKWLVGFIVGV